MSPLRRTAAVAAFYACFFGARQVGPAPVVLDTDQPAYGHDGLVEIRLRTRGAPLAGAPEVVVRKDGRDVTTIAGLSRLKLTGDGREFSARWPIPWNAPAGEYELVSLSGDYGGRLRARGFRVERRVPAPLPPGLAVLTLETLQPLETVTVRGPDGKKTDWTGMLDWAQYIGADAFWMLGARTPGAEGQVWLEPNAKMIPAVAKECRARGLKFGVYAMCYLTSSTAAAGGYQYAMEVEDGRPKPTRAVSLRDPKRPGDVAALLKTWAAIPEVDYVGLDYIRNALGGYELAEDFFREMPGVKPPPEWATLTPEERMVWFARKKIIRRDDAFIEAWQWWRAHKVASIVRRIKAELGEAKPLWAFTLTWEKGWHHGQDPVMMNDAGVDADALMLYEATREQYDAIVGHFRRYVKRGDVQLIVGDVVDWPLHQRDPDGPGEFYRRSVKAFDKIYADGPAHGLFFHDVGRALWGRVGPWSTREWLDQARRAADHAKGLGK